MPHDHHLSRVAEPALDSADTSSSSWAIAASATLHCLTGCAVGEVLGISVGAALGWGSAATITLAVVLAFMFGYAFSMRPLLKAGMTLGVAAALVLAADTLSIATMELVDNAVMLQITGAMAAEINDVLLWAALTCSLLIAFIVAWPVNRWLMLSGRGHALVYAYHHGHTLDAHHASSGFGAHHEHRYADEADPHRHYERHA